MISALGCMLNTGALADVTLIANGTTLKAHRLVLAVCSQYFAQLFKELESETGSLVIVLTCEPTELRLLLSFMYTGEVTAPRGVLPALLRLAHMLKVSGLTPEDTNSSLIPTETEECVDVKNSTTPINLDSNEDTIVNSDDFKTSMAVDIDKSEYEHGADTEALNTPMMAELVMRNEKDRLSKLDQIVQNLYTTHKIVNPVGSASTVGEDPTYLPKYQRCGGSVCNICNKRLSNQYNLRVHMETHAGARHRCHACTHVSRSRDALRKHVAYRHPHTSRLKD